MQNIHPFLWFDTKAEEAMHFYRSVFKNAKPGRRRQAGDCGWLKDKFGLSWQITPTVLIAMISDPDPGKSQPAMKR